MATTKQIVKAAEEFKEAQEHLQALKDRKQVLQDQLAEVNQRLGDCQALVIGFLASLKTLVNE